jgi:hypothetical protein
MFPHRAQANLERGCGARGEGKGQGSVSWGQRAGRDMAVCTIIRNEAPRLREWLAFHWVQVRVPLYVDVCVCGAEAGPIPRISEAASPSNAADRMRWWAAVHTCDSLTHVFAYRACQSSISLTMGPPTSRSSRSSR